MTSEWKRIWLNGRMLRTAAALLAVNLVVFVVQFLGLGNITRYQSLVQQRQAVFDELAAGAVTPEQLRQEQGELGIIQSLFSCQRAQQTRPEIYALAYQQMEQELRAEHPGLAAAFDAGDYEEQTVTDRSSVLTTVVASVDYSESFYIRLQEVFDSAEKLSGISIFQNSGNPDPNLTKTADDYRALAQIAVTPGNDGPIDALLGYQIPGAICLIFACLAVGQALVERQYNLRTLIYATKQGRGRLTAWRGLGLALGSGMFALLLYGSTIVLACTVLGQVELGRMAQSVPALFALTTPMTLGQFLGLYLCCGVAAQGVVTMAVWMLFSLLEQRQMALLAVAGVGGVSLLLYLAIPAQSFLAVLKFANLAAVVLFPQVLTGYRNLGVGSLLVEKNLLVAGAGLAAGVTCAGVAAWCGAKRYSIASHGRLYRRVQEGMGRMSEWYHRQVSRLPFLGLEGYKILMTQRGMLVLAAAALIFAQLYPVRQITYVGKDVILMEVYAEFGGQGVTPQLQDYVQRLQEKLDQVEADYNQAKEAFQAGELSPEDYMIQNQKYGAYDTQRNALSSLKEQISYLQMQQERGHEAVLLDTLGYERMVEQTFTDQIGAMICLFGVMLLHGFLFPMEQKKGLYQMIRSTPRGRRKLAGKKLALGLGLGGVCFGLFWGIRTYSIGASYGLPLLLAPAHSLELYSQSPLNLSLGATLALEALGQWMVFAAGGMLTCLLTQFLRRESALMAAAAVGIGTAVLRLAGLGVPTVWSALNSVVEGTRTGNWMGFLMTALALAGTATAAVWLWNHARRDVS